MNETTGKKGFISLKAVIAFFMTLSLCVVLISVTISNRIEVEKLMMGKLILEKGLKANVGLSRLMYKTQTLAAFVMQNGGQIENFEQIAASVIDDPSVLNVLLAPDGVVSHVYPREGNEAVLGMDLFSQGEGFEEAIEAKETERLVFGGPFESVQGGQVLIGRLPVFINENDGTRRFWGIVSATLKYPDALTSAGLDELHLQGFDYEIWRYNPESGQKQLITGCDYKYDDTARYIEKHINIQNSDWYFRILPVRAWYEYPDTWLLVFLSLCISVLVSFVVQNNSELQLLKTSYEKLSQMDSLTGVSNRRFFMDSSRNVLERTSRTKADAFIVLFDLDYFKKINDDYGHLAGDDVLCGVVKRVASTIRPYDLFARYGGEEFIILAADIKKDDVICLAERIRENIAAEPIDCSGILIDVTASFGISSVHSANELKEAIEVADKALYMAKDAGRNRVVFHEEHEA